MSRLVALGRRLPPPVIARIQAGRGAIARLVAGTELHKMRQEMDRLRDDVDALLARQSQDLVTRNDAVLSNYDRRVANVANRVLDLEARIGAGPADAVGDANRILAGHEEHPG